SFFIKTGNNAASVYADWHLCFIPVAPRLFHAKHWVNRHIWHFRNAVHHISYLVVFHFKLPFICHMLKLAAAAFIIYRAWWHHTFRYCFIEADQFRKSVPFI